MATPRKYYYDAKGKKKLINPSRSRAMKQVMAHRKGKKLSSRTKALIRLAVKRAWDRGQTKTKRPVKFKRKTT